MTVTRHKGLDIITGSAKLPGDYVVTEQQMKAASRTLSRQTTLSTGDEDSLRSAAGVVVTRPKKKRGMNKTEAEYAAALACDVRHGDIQWFDYEAITLKLADDCRYTPDFVVVHLDGRIEFREIKGFWRDDAKVKIRVAARLFPWAKFVAIRKRRKSDGGGWVQEEF